MRPALGCRIHIIILGCPDTKTGSDIDNFPTALLNHEGQNRPATVHCAREIGVYAGMPMRIGNGIERTKHAFRRPAGVVDQNVNLSEGGPSGFDHGIDRMGIRNINPHRQAAVALSLDESGGFVNLMLRS